MTDDRCDLLCLDLPRAESLRRSRLPADVAKRAAVLARATGDPTRLMLAAALKDGGEMCVCDLSWVAERSQTLVSHHLRVLRAAGLVSSRREGKMAMYALTDEGLGLLRAVLGEAVGAPT
ncbi:MAG: metalloregulator ArsR/SmtB family transcription factor [Actinomycetota bacterium]|nr:metalloregulator ArsR/SmtB family transcription factor [Actinomycetota bacterium]